ncbi:MAG: hypothetical protein LiPW30_185 [Parcubacteria group bacterium LiPW_30]|jgi:hypothetical protein|nr:MAG: hypothetical protein LiPW30_185 [Parcubacteria group bacterium LiPW_30]
MDDEMKEPLSEEALDGILGDDLLGDDGLPDDLDADDLGSAPISEEDEEVW